MWAANHRGSGPHLMTRQGRVCIWERHPTLTHSVRVALAAASLGGGSTSSSLAAPAHAPAMSEGKPSIAGQLATLQPVTARVPQKYLIQNQSGLKVFYWVTKVRMAPACPVCLSVCLSVCLLPWQPISSHHQQSENPVYGCAKQGPTVHPIGFGDAFLCPRAGEPACLPWCELTEKVSFCLFVFGGEGGGDRVQTQTR
jgi:hypothetical protein